MNHRLPALLLGAALLVLSSQASGGTPPPGGWGPRTGLNIGSSLAWVGGGESGHAFAPGLDLTYALKVNTPLFWWISAGARIWTGPEATGILPYAETGFSFMFLSLGAGWAPGFGNGVPNQSIHGFAGFTIPLWTPKKGHLLYLEPYWRPAWEVTDDNFPPSHEVGVLLKWFFMLTPKD